MLCSVPPPEKQAGNRAFYIYNLATHHTNLPEKVQLSLARLHMEQEESTGEQSMGTAHPRRTWRWQWWCAGLGQVPFHNSQGILWQHKTAG